MWISLESAFTTFLGGLQKLPKIGRPRDITFWRVELTSRETHVKYWITNLTHIKEQHGLLNVPVKIRFDDTYQFGAGSANVSVTTFLSSLQKLPTIGGPRDITFWRVEKRSRMVNWLYLSKLDLTRLAHLQQVQQMFPLQGLQNVGKILKVFWHQILTTAR